MSWAIRRRHWSRLSSTTSTLSSKASRSLGVSSRTRRRQLKSSRRLSRSSTEGIACASNLSPSFRKPSSRPSTGRISSGYHRAIDDVLDNLRDFIREWSLYVPCDGHPFTSLLETIGRGVESLRAAVGAISLRAGEPTPYLLAAKRDANRARRRFEEEVAALLTEEVTPEVLKRRELLRRLDIVGLRLGEATDTFSDALVKRGSGLSIFTKSTPRDAATEGK